MDSSTVFGQVQNDIPIIRNDVYNYNNSKETKYKATDLYSNAITRKIDSLKTNIDTIGSYVPLMNNQSLNYDTINKAKTTNLISLIVENEKNPASNIYKQREIDTLRGRINNSKLVNKSRVIIYIIYIFITLVIIGGLISMYWFPSKGRLDIFISIIAVLLLLLTFYQ